MANYEPTIVAASLNDSDLKASIDELVKYVKEKSTEMADAFDGQVERMKRKLGELGNVSINLGSDTKDGGTSQRTKKLKEEESQVKATQQAHKELKMTADQETEVIKNITSANSKKTIEEQANSKVLNDEVATLGQLREQYEAVAAQANRRFDVSTIQQLRMQQHELEAGMRVASREAERSKKDVEDMTSAIENYRRTMQYLPKTPQGIENARDIQKQINEMTVLRDAAKDEQQKWVESGRKLSGQYENVKAQIRQIGQGLVDADRAEQERVQGAKQYSAEIRKQAQEIRANESFKKQGFFDFSDATGHWMRVFANEKKFGAVEQQLVDLERIKANYSKEVYNYEEKSTKERKSWVNAQDRINTAEERYLASLASEEEKQRSAKKHLLEAKTIYDDINRNQERSKSMSVQWQYETTIDSLARIRDAYNNLTSEDKKSEFGKNMSARIKDLEKDLGSLAEKMKDESLMAYDLGNSYLQLSRKLTRLQSIYQSLNEEERNSSRGKGIAEKIQETSRNISQIQKQMTRPTSLESVLGFEPKTLDDIAYKMRQLQAYKQGIDLTKQNAANEIKQVDDALRGLQKQMDKYMGKSRQVGEINNALSRSWNYMKNRLAFYFSVSASTSFIKNLIEIRSQYEMNERALGILIGSAERGTQIFKELSEMALVSPYTLIELSSAAKQLTAYDVAARDVVDTTRRLADMASAVGVPMERLTYALGQIKAYGYLNSRDARMFANAGIPLVKQLAEYYTELEGKMVSTGDVYDRMKKKAIDYNDVMQVVNKMTDEGGKFFDFQAKMADTLKVRLANLTLAWNNMLNDIGKSTQSTLTWSIGALRDLFLHWKQIDALLSSASWIVGIRTAALFTTWATLKFAYALGATKKQMALSVVFGEKLANVLRTIGRAFWTLVKSPVTWLSLLALALVDITQKMWGVNEAQKTLNESIRNGAKDNYENISKFTEQYQTLRKSLYKKDKDGNIVPQDIDKNEAKKAWEAVREQIELTIQSSNDYVGRLLAIENISERVRQGFKLLNDVKTVSAALSKIDEDTIKVSQDWSSWWNLWMLPDGLVENIKDVEEAEQKLLKHWDSVEDARGKGVHWVKDYDEALSVLKRDVEKTAESVMSLISLKGWSGDIGKIDAVFSQIGQKLALENGLTPNQAYILQAELENSRSKAAKDALVKRIADEKASLKISYDEDVKLSLARDEEELANWEKYNGRARVEWERFAKWMKEEHIYEMTSMFRDMDAKQIKSLNFQSGKYSDFVTKMVTKYAKEHKMSYDEAFSYLRHWVQNANRWSIFIPLTIGTEDDKTIYETLTEADKAADAAWQKIERLKKRKKELEKNGGGLSRDEKIAKEYAKTLEEIESAEKDYNAALAKGGHSKKEDRKDAQDRKKAESELQKAIKEELRLIDKVRSVYKELTKEGVTHADAIMKSTDGFDKSVRSINQTFTKFGIDDLELGLFAGTTNPKDLLDLLERQLDALLKSGSAKPSEIESLQIKIKDIKVDVEKFNQQTFIKSINSELDRYKDEYELAVELDANPELGATFSDMFGIDSSDFPRTIDEYMERVQKEFDKALRKWDYNISLNVFKVDEQGWKDLGKNVGLSTEALDKFKAKFVDAQGVAKKWATDVVKQTQNLEYKLAETNGKIAIEEKKLANLRNLLRKESNEDQRKLLGLQIQDQEDAIAKLKEEALQLLPTYKNLFNSIVEHSALVTRKIAKQWKTALENAAITNRNGKKYYTITDPNSGQRATITSKEYGTQIDKVNTKLRETQSTFDKIHEAFAKGEDDTNDWAKGLELISDEAKKVADGLGVVVTMMKDLGASDESIEVMNDLITSINGVGDAMQGVAQFASGDYIGGIVNMFKGLWEAISTWFDNSDKKILKNIKASERTVKELEMAYKQLQETVEDAYGMMEVGAKRAAVENKKLQLEELKRQLQLQESRRKKKQDEDEMRDLRGQIQDLTNEIKNDIQEITDSMLGISSVGDAAETLVSSMIDAFRQGEDYMKVYEDTFEDMVDNMIMKAIVGRVIGDEIDKMLRQVEEAAEFRAVEDPEVQYWKNAVEHWKKRIKESEEEEKSSEYIKGLQEFLQDAEQNLSDAYAKALTPTIEDIKTIGNMKDEFREGVQSKFEAWMDAFGISYGDRADKNLSNLQQGIQGITEDTASALEGYMNIVSQRIFEHGTILTDIRDTLKGFDFDLGLGVQSQMLLQLQSSYQVQISIQNILNGVLNPSGRAFVVELNS